MTQSIATLLAQQARDEFIGRAKERAALRTTLETEGPRLTHIHGIAGIGKSALLNRFTTDARHAGAAVVALDCRHIEPTEKGFLHALGDAIGDEGSVEVLTQRLGALGATVVLALDTYDVFRLMDTWLRQVFVPCLPGNVRMLFFGRERPYAGWHALPGGRLLLQSIALGALDDDASVELLGRLGMRHEASVRIARYTHGHPLALRLAAAACAERPGLALEQVSLLQALDELTRMFLAEAGDATTRHILEGASVTRRITISLLRALFPTLAPQDAYDRLQRLPFVETAADGLLIHDAVREAIARSVRASDPSRYLSHQRTAWRLLRAEAASAGGADLWRYTADILYLVENPVVREAFFPTGTQQLAVEPAHGGDADGVRTIIDTHEAEDAAGALKAWWQAQPETFSVVRRRDGAVVGLCCKLPADALAAGREDDPIVAQWRLHLARNPLQRGERALFCRRWLSLDEGESPSEVQAAIWLDLKRTYMEMRPRLRRVYVTVRDLSAYAAVVQRLGFVVLGGYETVLDGVIHQSAALDFGSGSVDGWLADLAAAELGVTHGPAWLDVDARELVLDGTRRALTPLEFDLLHYMTFQPGKAVSRGELLRQVWGPSYAGSSNVVDAVVCTLRRKLASESHRLETVSGVGYRLRQ
jgi:DNA-binding response OmpR family regulator